MPAAHLNPNHLKTLTAQIEHLCYTIKSLYLNIVSRCRLQKPASASCSSIKFLCCCCRCKPILNLNTRSFVLLAAEYCCKQQASSSGMLPLRRCYTTSTKAISPARALAATTYGFARYDGAFGVPIRPLKLRLPVLMVDSAGAGMPM